MLFPSPLYFKHFYLRRLLTLFTILSVSGVFLLSGIFPLLLSNQKSKGSLKWQLKEIRDYLASCFIKESEAQSLTPKSWGCCSLEVTALQGSERKIKRHGYLWNIGCAVSFCSSSILILGKYNQPRFHSNSFHFFLLRFEKCCILDHW